MISIKLCLSLAQFCHSFVVCMLAYFSSHKGCVYINHSTGHCLFLLWHLYDVQLCQLCSTFLCCQATNISLGASTPPSVSTCLGSFEINDLKLFCVLFVLPVGAHKTRLMMFIVQTMRSKIVRRPKVLSRAEILKWYHLHQFIQMGRRKCSSTKRMQAFRVLQY